MPFDIEKVRVEPLNGLHVLDRFVCRSRPIQEFCRRTLSRAHDSYAVRAVVATHDGDPRIVGYYYLSLSTVSHDAVDRAVEDNFLHLDAIPTVYLGMIGVDQRLERKGIGKRLMTDALARVASIARNAGTFALTLDAIDEAAADYYESQFDFRRFTDGGLKMFLAVPTILALDLPSPADA